MPTATSIRTASSSDIEQICRIDTDASSIFAAIPSLEDLASGSHGDLEPRVVESWLASGSIYVIEEEGRMLGFITVQPHDDVLYVAELSVLRSQQGQGLGSQLLEKAFAHARSIAREAARSVARVSLTTYPDVPWNGPWYRKRDFHEIDAENLGSWHVEKVQRDDEDLARPGYRRCCMLREEAIDLES